jgi:hypothetical protein
MNILLRTKKNCRFAIDLVFLKKPKFFFTMKLILQLALWVLIIFFGWKLYSSIIGPVEFNEKRDARYAKVIKNLKDVRDAELAHKEITGKFTGSFDSLVRFIDTAQFAITQRRDTSYADEKKNKAYGLNAKTGGYILEAVLIDTLDYVSVKERTFNNTDRYKTMMIIPLEEEGITDTIELRVGEVIKNQGRKNEKAYSAFEARISKKIILEGLDKDLINQEEQVVSVEGVNGAFVKVGSLEEVDTSGNWPKIYDAVPDNTKNEKSKNEKVAEEKSSTYPLEICKCLSEPGNSPYMKNNKKECDALIKRKVIKGRALSYFNNFCK